MNKKAKAIFFDVTNPAAMLINDESTHQKGNDKLNKSTPQEGLELTITEKSS